MKIRIFNVKYIPNLGDGLLSECLEAAIRLRMPAADVESIDLGRRENWNFEDGYSIRPLVLGILSLLPAQLKEKLLEILQKRLMYEKFKAHYARHLTGADRAVIGGGNLITDLDLNFPTKIKGALMVAHAAGIPVSFYGVGVGKSFGAVGKQLLVEGLQAADVKAVFVRDEKSSEYWTRHFKDITGLNPQIVRDPGLLVAKVRPVSRISRPKPLIAIGIIAPVAINYHTDVRTSSSALSRFFLDMADSLVALGFDVLFFNNGSPEDRTFMAKLKSHPAAADRKFVDCTSVGEMCSTIGTADCVVAHRMHAIIASYAYKVPFVALNWDEKLNSFVRSVNCEHWLFSAESQLGAQCANLIQDVMSEGIDPDTHDRVIQEADRGIDMLVETFGALEQHAGPGRGK